MEKLKEKYFLILLRQRDYWKESAKGWSFWFIISFMINLFLLFGLILTNN